MERAVTRVLIAEDEPAIAGLITRGLSGAGIDSDVAAAGDLALSMARSRDYDLLLLDLGLPGLGGMEVLRTLREEYDDLPVIIVTARGATSDVVAGLRRGAADYVVKPFDFEELLVRIQLRLREHVPAADFVLRVGDLSLDVRTRRLHLPDRAVELTAREFELLEFFMRHPDQVLTRGQLLGAVWGLDFDPGTNIVDVYVRRLRNRVGAWRITTQRHAGYRLLSGPA